MDYEISNHQFLSAIAGADAPRVHVSGFHDDPLNIPNTRRGICWAGGPFSSYGLRDGDNQYFTISVFHPDAEGKARRRKALHKRTFCLVLDDVYEKLPIDQVKRLPKPSWKLETSKDNEQWGYILDPNGFIDWSRQQVDNVLDGLVAKGLAPTGNDPGMKGVTRYVRLPEGSNRKDRSVDADGVGFKCRMVEWEPGRKVSLPDLAKPFDIDIDAVRNDSDADGKQVLDTEHPVLQVVDVLEDCGGGKYKIICPFINEHSGADTSGTAIWTYEDGRAGFDCKHGHCDGRSGKDLMNWCGEQEGWEDLKRNHMFNLVSKPLYVPPSNIPPAVPAAPAPSSAKSRYVEADILAAINQLNPASSTDLIESVILMFCTETEIRQHQYLETLARQTGHTVSLYKSVAKRLRLTLKRNTQGDRGSLLLPEIAESGRCLDTLDNFNAMLTHYGIVLRFNEMTHSIDVTNMPSVASSLSENTENVAQYTIENLCERHELGSRRTGKNMLVVADSNPYHPAIQWLKGDDDGAWDGRSRIDQLMATLIEPDDLEFSQKVFGRTLVIKWMTSAVACLYGYKNRPPRGVLVLVGDQEAGKTSWFRMLFPEGMFFDGGHMNTQNKDSIIQLSNYWCTELGEIERSIKHDDAGFKAYVGSTMDEVRKPYAAQATKIPRRTVLCGSSNDGEFLGTPVGGATRIWPIRIKDVDLEGMRAFTDNGGAELRQLWLEIETVYYRQVGASWSLTDTDRTMLDTRNAEFTQATPLDVAVGDLFDWTQPKNIAMPRFTIMQLCKVQSPRSKHYTEMMVALKSRGVVVPKGKVKINGVWTRDLMMPPLRAAG